MALFGGLFGQSESEKLAEQMQGRYDDLAGQSVSESAGFQSGQAALRQLLSRQRRADEATAARSGAQGSELSIAQAAGRSRQQADSTAQLVGDADRRLADRRSRALSRLIQAQGMADRDKQRAMQSITGAISGLGGAAMTVFGGPAGAAAAGAAGAA